LVGNQPIDDGNYLFTEAEKDAFLANEPGASKFMASWIGSKEFINGGHRYCLWLAGAPAADLRALPEVMNRVEAVRKFRQSSKRKSTLKLAETPTRFQVETMPTSSFVVIPEVSSEGRSYIPMGFESPNPRCLYSNLVKVVPNATLFHFGVLTSAMHMAWVRRVCGRMKSDYRYSIGIVYNNFPWPRDPTPAQVKAVEKCAQGILDARAGAIKESPATSLADLYSAVMPSTLSRAHGKLNLAVERCYRPKPFKNDLGRVRFLFALYQKYCPTSAPLESYPYLDMDEA